MYSLTSHMPIYYLELPGNMHDSRTIEMIVTELEHAGFKNVILITDRGYESMKNLEVYIAKNQKVITSVKCGQGEALKAIKDIDLSTGVPEGMAFSKDTNLFYKQFDLDYKVQGNGDHIIEANRLKLNLYFDIHKRVLCQQDPWAGPRSDGGEEQIRDAGRAGEDLHASERPLGRRPLEGVHGVFQARQDIHLLCCLDTGVVYQAHPRLQAGTSQDVHINVRYPLRDASHTLHRARWSSEVHHTICRRPTPHLRRLWLRGQGRVPSNLHIQEVNQGEARPPAQAADRDFLVQIIAKVRIFTIFVEKRVHMDNFGVKRFSEIDLNDSFFNSLKDDYPEFAVWYKNKAERGEQATVYIEDGKVKDFLYLKEETESLGEPFRPALPKCKRLKIGTFKVEARGTRRGERLIKRALDYAVSKDVDEVYVTVFPKHDRLISLFKTYGFQERSKKYHDGETYELVLVKDMHSSTGDVLLDYPYVHTSETGKYLLSIYPKYHTALFPDSILNNESPYDVIKDLSHTNSIHKAYICFMKDVELLRGGDNVIIYRTSDIPGKAFYRSVVTSVCVVKRVRSKSDFINADDFINQVKAYSIFTESDLRLWFKKPNVYLVEMTYNVSLKKRITRGELIESIGLDPNAYWGFLRLTDSQYKGITKKGMADESYFID